jgi:phage/plasmid-associated DNA primase
LSHLYSDIDSPFISDAKIESAKPTGNVHWMVPRAMNNLFTGRTELLDRIQNALLGDRTSYAETQKTFVITGLGGQGKSEVCLKLANLVQEECVQFRTLLKSLLL